MAGLFNAPTGRELAEFILKEVRDELAGDVRFSDQRGQAREGFVIGFKFSLIVEVESYPSEPPTFTVEVSRSFKASPENPFSLERCRELIQQTVASSLAQDERFLQHRTYPRLTWSWKLNTELASTGPIPKAAEVSSRKSNPSHVIDLSRVGQGDVVVQPEQDRRALLKELYSDRGNAAQLDQLQRQNERLMEEIRLLKTGAGADGGLGLIQPPASPVTLSPLEVRHRSLDNVTGTGLTIEGGFRPSPGMIAAGSYGEGSPVGPASGTVVNERAELGVSHPSLAEGGQGSADALRRAAGLPIPQTHTTPSGHVVDLGLGDTF